MVMHAIEHAWGGEIFIPKIPSYRITDVATAVAPNCEQVIVGIRPGEKIHETLASAEELSRAFDLGDHLRIPMLEDRAPLDNNAGTFMAGREFTSANAQQLDVVQTQTFLRAIPQVAQALGS